MNLTFPPELSQAESYRMKLAVQGSLQYLVDEIGEDKRRKR